MMNKHNLTNDELYFADEHYMSTSRWKKLNKCEVGGLEPFPSEKSDALMVGSYVDAYVEGTIEKFKEDNPTLFSTRNPNKGQLKAPYRQADIICDYIDNDPRLRQFLSGEKQTVMVGEIAGVPYKIKLDSYIPGKLIADLKVMRTVTDKSGEFYDFITPWGYDVQMATYQEIVYQNTGEKLPCYIVAVTKETPIDSVVVQIPQNLLDIALYKVESSIVHLNEVRLGTVNAEGCGTCKACVSAREITPIISLGDFYFSE